MSARHSDQRRAGAFTLVELLVVVAIITILVALLIPALSSAKKQSKTASCLANIKGICAAEAMYGQENSDQLNPSFIHDAGVTPNQDTGLDKLLAPWLSSDVKYNYSVAVGASPVVMGASAHKIWICPDPGTNVTVQYPRMYSESQSPHVSMTRSSSTTNWSTLTVSSHIPRPSEVVSIADSALILAGGDCGCGPFNATNTTTNGSNFDNPTRKSYLYEASSFVQYDNTDSGTHAYHIRFRHGSAGNVACIGFVDGHADTTITGFIPGGVQPTNVNASTNALLYQNITITY